VTVWRSTNGGSSWTQDGYATYDSASGTYKANRSLTANTTYQVRFQGMTPTQLLPHPVHSSMLGLTCHSRLYALGCLRELLLHHLRVPGTRSLRLREAPRLPLVLWQWYYYTYLWATADASHAATWSLIKTFYVK